MMRIKVKEFDVAVIGAGIHGAGVAQAAVAAGYSVIVLEKKEIAAGTSCKSSKLIHGGLRYLESYQFSLVRKSLKERAILCRLAPELVKLKPFYIPVYKKTTRRSWQIKLGLLLYSFLGGFHKNNLFTKLSHNEVSKLDGLIKAELQDVYKYYDGQTNDASLTRAVILSAMSLGAEFKYPANVVSVLKENNGFKLTYNNESIQAKVLINAAGPWVNELLEIVSPKASALNVDLIQGTHIIIDTPTAPSGIYYLEAKDKRAVFVMPYEFDGELKTMIGTTEKKFQGKADDVTPSKEEEDYLLNVYKKYFPECDGVKILDKFAGLRVLPESSESTFSKPRDTVLHWSLPNLLTLYGGKLTAYRSTSELVIKKIKPVLGKRRRVAYTNQLFLSAGS